MIPVNRPALNGNEINYVNQALEDGWISDGPFLKKFEDDFWSGINIEKLHKSIESSPAHPMEAIFVTGMKELTTSNRKSINKKNTDLLDPHPVDPQINPPEKSVRSGPGIPEA